MQQIEKMEELLELLEARKKWLDEEMKYVKDKTKKVRWMLNNLNQIELELDEVRKHGESPKNGQRKSD